MRVGLTGGVGSGKSTVSAMLAELGAVVVDADLLAREVVAPGTEGLAEIEAAFGPRCSRPTASWIVPPWGRSSSPTRRGGGSWSRSSIPGCGPVAPRSRPPRPRGRSWCTTSRCSPRRVRPRPSTRGRGRHPHRGAARPVWSVCAGWLRRTRSADRRPGRPRRAAGDRDVRRREHRHARGPPSACGGGLARQASRVGSSAGRRAPRQPGRGRRSDEASAAPHARAGGPARPRCRAWRRCRPACAGGRRPGRSATG